MNTIKVFMFNHIYSSGVIVFRYQDDISFSIRYAVIDLYQETVSRL